MATYVTSDLHGEYDRFIRLLDEINLKDEDTLFVLGDVIDRGPHPIKLLQKLMTMPNVICLVGNHELMGLEVLEFLNKEITEDSIEELDVNMTNNIITWQMNGSKTTTTEFHQLSAEERQDVIDFIRDFSVYEKVEVNGQKYLLVHAGLGNYSPEKDIEDYSLYELLWMRADYNQKYFDDVYVISGHTPTQTIEDNSRPGYIYRKNNHIAIDCGACFSEGRLAALCLDTGKEYYVE